ncbi:MAG TPA: hypothetical protein VGG64_30420 [Pirellulales bacterium]
MKATPQFVVGMLLAALSFSALCQTASGHPATVVAWTGMAAVGQSGARNADPKREVASLLARARKAMAEADWETAETLISKADAQHVQFGKLYFGDTPEKARRELEHLRPLDRAPGQKEGSSHKRSDALSQIPPAEQALGANRKSGASAQLPVAQSQAEQKSSRARLNNARGQASQRNEQAFPPMGERSPAGATNPFEAVDRAEAQAAMVTRLPATTPPVAMPPVESVPAEIAAGLENAVSVGVQNAVGGDPSRAQSDRLLLASRKAMAVGDATQAARLVAQAKALGVAYDLHEDNPAKVEATIQKAAELAKLAANKESEGYRRKHAELLMSQAETLLLWREYDDAERLANDASRLPVAYGPFDAKPDDLLGRVAAARRRSGRFKDNAVSPAGLDVPAESNFAASPSRATIQQPAAGARAPGMPGVAAARPAGAAQRAIYDSSRDTTQNIPVTATDSRAGATEDLFRIPDDTSVGAKRVSGEVPAEISDEETAPPAQSSVQIVPEKVPVPLEPSVGSLLKKTTVDQQVLARKVIADLAAQRSEAKRLQTGDPKRSLEILQQARVMVEKSGLDQETRDRLLRSADRGIADAEQYIETNRPRIELEDRNRAVKDEIDREQKVKVEVQEKLAYEVDQFNKLVDEQRYAEAEVVAKRAMEMAPHEAVVQQLQLQARFLRRLANTKGIQADKEDGFVEAMNSIDAAATPFDDRNPIRFTDVDKWNKLSQSPYRKKLEGRSHRSEKEIEIDKSLKTPVSLKFHDAPLSEVMDHLKTLAGVNIHLDPRGLAAEGMTSDTPVNIDLTEPISLKSALNLILEPLHLSYIVKNEVLNITSEEMRDGEVYTDTYNVGDLIVPIPNFTPDGNMGLTGALNSAQANARAGMVGGVYSGDVPLAVASASGANTNAVMDPRVLAQMASMGAPMASVGQPGGGGPGGLSGGAQPDFDSLIDLIVQTIQPESWDANGGPGTITRFQNNLSLVISQKQDVHEEIAQLLSQLRRLHDLQVTIEVRFITLNDNFFERIGVDFQMSLQDFAPATLVGSSNVGTLGQGPALQSYDPQLTQATSATVGTQGAGLNQFTDNLNIDLSQGSFTAAVPQFGSYSAGTGATLGFAILSDIEAYFFIEASQGDRRSNVLQAPKVTLFNGQQAFVSDTSQSPFVISVIPVVGDFAAAQQPVIVVLSEGTMLTVQAVVSEDRRFVRLTLVPFFSSIGAVNTFTFTGSSSSTSNSASQGATDNTTGRSNATTTVTEGTTVQLPTFSFVSVSTTVSVPDGGTVLLGGVKRLSEGRNEFGVPILNKIPYINRLFQNTAIGRQSESLMMMVTPRIIIQEEEEFNLTGQNPPNP